MTISGRLAKLAMQSPSSPARLFGLLRPSLIWPTPSPSPSPSLDSNNNSPSEKKPLRSTAYLDGLRGFAAFLVYWHHHILWAHKGLAADFIESGFGYLDKHLFSTYPFIRIFFGGGHYAVSTFYVISGYVLSTKPLTLIHTGEQAKLADNLGSALFRRWLRLFIPLICTTFLYMTSWHVFGIWTEPSKAEPSYGAEIVSWYKEMKAFSFVFNQGDKPWFSYNFHLWSIPLEFKGSIVIYTSLLALARCSRNARLWCQVGLIYYFLYIVDGWYCALFVAGMLLGDLDLLAAKDDLPAFLARLEPFSTVIYYHLLVISLYLGGVPVRTQDINDLATNNGWYYLSFFKPQAVYDYKWFYLFWAAVLLVASIPRISWLKRFFETGFCQYLGRISFSLYLVHGPILWTLGDRLYAAVGWATEEQMKHIPGWVNKLPLSKAGPFCLEVGFLLPNIILLPVTLYCAEMVTRAFDEPSVRFPQWLYKQTQGRPARIPPPLPA
ncbi:acyltransferase family-domain-containing protein [Apodospora peruviana]|uniref:Acyltransferase family-domain-containing protein n=1 Tax=Apodospora peruviana TaxID=516989 RepID=A0AAE0M9B6_9PEZI|nr:acyltransferase family-domain-containing protein [Apodospora peruviana]